LTLMALLGLMAAFLMPAIAQVRIKAMEARSTNNLKQIGIACHNYHDTNGNFPAGNNKNNFSAAALLLPYVEQDALYKTINFDKASDDKDNATARKSRILVFLSPLDPVESVNDDGATNYLFNAGTATSLTANNGVFYQDSNVKIQTITDGTSNTAMVVETLKGDGGKKAMDVRRQHVAYKADELKNLKEQSGVDDWKDNKNIVGTRCSSWMDGRFLQGTINAGRKPNDASPDVDCGGEGGLAGPRSRNDRMPVAMCDGSVRFIDAKKIQFDTWKSAMTANGGEVLGNDF
jgi:hypothetical protein